MKITIDIEKTENGCEVKNDGIEHSFGSSEQTAKALMNWLENIIFSEKKVKVEISWEEEEK